MFEGTEAKKPWRFEDSSPSLLRRQGVYDDSQLDKKEDKQIQPNVSLSDDEVFIKPALKKAKSKFFKHAALNVDNINLNKTSSRQKSNIPEKRPGICDGIPKKKVRFDLPLKPDMESANIKNCQNMSYEGCVVQKRLKRQRLAAIDLTRSDYEAYIDCPKKKKTNHLRDETEDMYSVKLLCAQFAHTDLGK